MMVMLLVLYPRLSTRSLVGTDLVQAVPLVASATVAHALFGHISLGLTASLLVGSMPGVYAGAKVSSRAPDGIIRPALILILLGSALKLLGLGTATLGGALVIFVLVSFPLWAAADAALRPESHWERAGRRRTVWVMVQSVGAPFGLGALVAAWYVLRIRPALDQV